MIPATDIDGSRRWYEKTLGFSPIEEYPDRSAAYRSGDSQFNVYAAGSAGTAQFTLTWFKDPAGNLLSLWQKR